MESCADCSAVANSLEYQSARERPARPGADNKGGREMSKDYLTVVIQLPDDPGQREAVREALPLSGVFNGGRITAVSLEDEITVNELLEAKLDSDDVDEARAQAKALAARAEVAVHPVS